ncbi:MAG: SpoIIIAC/SpoIIIAD family protein [Lachnospirales bacterium]
MIFFSIIAIAFIGLFVSLILKNYNQNQSFATFVAIITCILIVIKVLPYFSEVLKIFSELSELISNNDFYIEEIVKIIGITYIAEISQALCVDSGQSAIGQKIELASKIVVLYMGYPIILNLLEIVLNISRWT